MQISKFMIILFMLFSSNIFAKYYEHPQNLYNQAISAYQNNDLGSAMFYTKKAFMLAPNNKFIRPFFFKLRKEIGLPSIFSEDTLSKRITSSIFQGVAPHYNAILAGFMFIIGSIFVSLMLLKKINNKPSIYIVSFTLSLFLITQAIIQYYYVFNVSNRIVLSEVQLYEEPSTESTILEKIPAGTEVEVIDQTDNFILVRLLNGTEAWSLTNSIPPLFINK